MGLSVGGRCFGTAVQAAQAECATYPRSFAGADGVVSYSCAGVSDDGGQLSIVRTDTAGASSSATLVVSFPACDDMQPYTDATLIWSAGLAALVAVWCVRAFVLKLVTNQ